VYACFGIFFISCLSQVTLILRHLPQPEFRGKLSSPSLIALMEISARIATLYRAIMFAHASMLTE
jgi:hypothetical protein